MRKLKTSMGILFVICFLTFIITGCGQNETNPVAPAERLTKPETSGPISFRILLPGQNNSVFETAGSLIGSVRAESSTLPDVTFKLTLVNIGNAGNPASKVIKTVKAGADGTAEVTFNGIPAGTCVGDIHIEGGNIAGFSDFHGAADLIAGVPNTLYVTPKGSRLQSDFVAHVIEQIVQTPILFGKALPGLTSQVAQAISGLDRSGESAYSDAVSMFARYVDLTIKISAGLIKVSYFGNGNEAGSVPFDSNYYEAGAFVMLAVNSGNLARAGFSFTGWNSMADGTGTHYDAGSTIKLGTEDLNLFAQWASTGVEAPNTVGTLATTQQVYSYSNTAENVLMKLPVQSGTTVNYLLTVTNSGSTAQTVQLFPETLLFGSNRPEESLHASLPTVEDAELMQMMAVKGRLEEKLRCDTINAMRQSGGNLRASLRASDHSDEILGGIYPISVVADGMGFSYSTRNCKLERMTAHCKIFVDQDSFELLSAVSGTYAVTSADLDHFAEEFEAYIYPLLNGGYGPVYDIDNDGRISLLISPVYAKTGFAGLFNSIDMTPGATTNSSQRDLIGVWSPSSAKWSGAYWLAATRETIAHEMQHAVNYSAKVYPNGVVRTGIDNYDSLLEEIWLDESLSVGVEARYRAVRGAAGKTTYYNSQTITDTAANDARFGYWAQNPHTVKVDSFSYATNAFEHYGQKGLFNFYLFEQYGADKIRSLVQTTSTGVTNFNNVFGAGSFAGIVKNWQFAVVNEGLRSVIAFNGLDAKYRYTTPMNITIHKAVQLDAAYLAAFISVQPGATAFYAIRQPSNISVSEYKFRIQSTEGQGIEINMMRLP